MQFTVTKTENLWCIEMSDGTFMSHLGWDEMLGVVAKITLAKEPPYGGFRTYEQEVAGSRWLQACREENGIAGLIEGPR